MIKQSTTDLYKKYIAIGGTVCTDTRKIIPGSIFFALKGPNFNANSFALNALEQGCSYAVVDEPVEGEHSKILLVEDTLKALQDLALYHRKTLDLKVLAIGGSNGKTTTKELVYRVLSQNYKTIHTSGNLNNQIGVPLTLLTIKSDIKIAVIEMGANKIGDMEELCLIAEPDFGIITNIGKEHLEGFGNIEGVAQGESELFDFLNKTGGFAFINADDSWLINMSKRLSDKMSYGFINPADLHLSALSFNPKIEFELEGIKINANLSGDYNFQNVLAACAIGKHFKISASKIKTAIESYIPENNRSQIIKTENNTLFLDAYNANPSSMEAAIGNFATFPNQKKLLVLGDMFELGEHAEAEHLSMLEYCMKKGFTEALVAGELFSKTKMPEGYISFKNSGDLKEFLGQKKYTGYDVLLKGSRGMKMEEMTSLL